MIFGRLVWVLFLSVCLGLSPAFSNDKATILTPLSTLYDYHLIDSHSQKPISLDKLVKNLANKDVIFIGEFHGNHAVHLFQAQLQTRLFQQNPKQLLSLEQFNRDQQTILNRYLDGEIGEKTLIHEAPTWPNYAASYRPLITFAKQQFIPVIAANASADIVRCVGREGKPYLKKLPEESQKRLPKDPFYSDPAYQAKFDSFGQHRPANSKPGKSENNTYYAQLLRDNSMAEAIHLALIKQPEHQLIHLNGAFHSNEYLGTVSALKHRDSTLKIAVISPVRQTDLNQPNFQPGDLALGDYLLLVPPQPTDYVQASKRRAAMKSMFEKAKAKPCL